jgi:N-acetylmuramoyl-L-alanine amidase
MEKLESKPSDLTTKPQATAPEKPTTLTPIPPSPVKAKIVTVTWTFGNIRSGAGDNYSLIATVKQGDKLIVIGESGEWFNVRLENGQEGWIKNTVVK